MAQGATPAHDNRGRAGRYAGAPRAMFTLGQRPARLTRAARGGASNRDRRELRTGGTESMLRVGIAGLRRGAGYATLFDAQAEATVVALCDTDPTVLSRAAARWPHATPCTTYAELLAMGL